MGILGTIESKQKRFSVGGREVLCIDVDLPTGESPAAMHFLSLVERLCAYAEREQLPHAADALIAAVRVGKGHCFTKCYYRIALQEEPVGRRRRVTLTVSFPFFDERLDERIERFHRLETLWDAAGVLQIAKMPRKRGRTAKNKTEDVDRKGSTT